MNSEIAFPDEAIVSFIKKTLLNWGRHNLRDYPWRKTRDPYRILLAEMLLQRTRADQVRDIYIKMVDKYPTVVELSRAERAELEKMLRPLGLRWRVPLILDMARQVMERYSGSLPTEREQLKELPGVGDYAASAMLCFAYNLPEPILDTNTVRVIGRLFGIDVRDSSRRSRKFREIMGRLVDREQPRLFNLALLDFAALVCRKHEPLCNVCPLQEICKFGRKQTVGRELARANRTISDTDGTG